MATIAETAQGRFRGTTRKGTQVFRGIPYALPPVGPLRFRPPEPPEPFDGVRDASETGPAAPQTTPSAGRIAAMVGGGAESQEDCLYLNLWTPACDGGRRPVLVWIHGGAFVMGSGSTPIYSGRRLSRRGDAVVITINYRLGALGFLQLSELQGSDAPVASNLGIRDQIRALAWVRENITAFGGDPGNVTIFGESAGAMSVGTLLGIPEARGLFHRAILQSGAGHNVSTPEAGARVGEAFLDELGIRPGRARGLRDIPVEEILAAQHRTTIRLGIAHGTLPWQPAVDGELLVDQPLHAIARGDAADIPVLLGTNRDEWKLFTLFDRGARNLDEDTLRRRLDRALPGKDEEGVAHAQRVIEVYRSARSGRGRLSASELWADIQSDRIFRYPATRLAELQAQHQPDTYSYLFEWAPPLLRRRVGSCHAIEIPLVFGTHRHPIARGLFAGARDLSRTMQLAWLAFARDGRPTGGELGGWEGYGERRNTMVLGRRNYLAHAPLERERVFWDAHLRL